MNCGSCSQISSSCNCPINFCTGLFLLGGLINNRKTSSGAILDWVASHPPLEQLAKKYTKI